MSDDARQTSELVHEDGRAKCPTEDCDWWVPEGMEYAYSSHDCEGDEPEYWGEDCAGCGEFLGLEVGSVIVGSHDSDDYYHLDCHPRLGEDDE